MAAMTAGIVSAARMAMIEMTTSISTSVKPAGCLLGPVNRDA